MRPSADGSLSLCMIVKNEEATLSRCLDSVRALAPEVIIADTGSTDATAQIAARYGATVTPVEFAVVDFAAARNHALAHASGRWILALDADEVLYPASVPMIREAVARNENAGYYFQRVNHRLPAHESTTDYVVRLFPNRPGYRYRGRVHETVDASILAGGGRLLRSEVRIDHDFATDPESRRRKNLWYIGILKEEIAADPGDQSRLVFLGAEYHQLGRFEEATEIALRLARMRPHDPEAQLHAGVYQLLYKLDRERARVAFAEALRLRPGHAAAQSFLQMIEEQRHGPSIRAPVASGFSP